MNTDRIRRIARAAIPMLGALPLLAACTDGLASTGTPASSFGEANRQTMLAQVVDPDPQYDTLVPATSAQHAGQAADRYAADKVKKPERVRSTQSPSGSSGSSSN